MAFGMKIIGPNGQEWISPEFTPYNLVNIAVISSAPGSYMRSDIPENEQCLFFVRFDSYGFVEFEEVNIDGYKSLRVKGTDGSAGNIVVYAFGTIVTNIPKYGAFVFNNNGKMVYHCGMKPLEMYKVGIRISDGPVNVGGTCAVSPTFSGLVSDPGPNGYRIWKYCTGAYGNMILNTRVQVGLSPGPAGITYQTDALYILTDKYN